MVLDNYTRWCNWMLLEHGPAIQSQLPSGWESYFKNVDKFSNTRLYFGCGHDSVIKKYKSGWDLCDLREVPGVIVWDALMGFPYPDASMEEIKSKLTLGMFNFDQVKFIFREVARLLEEGGEFDLTFRDFSRLTERMKKGELEYPLFVRYIYGSGKYYGSRRRSCWTAPEVEIIAEKYNLMVSDTSSRGMNTVLTLTRVPGKLKAFSPEPKVNFDKEGNMVNEGGDFPSESRSYR